MVFSEIRGIIALLSDIIVAPPLVMAMSGSISAFGLLNHSVEAV